MPEGPEVKVIVDGLNNVLKNKYIKSIEITPNSRYRNKAPNGFNDFKDFILNKKTDSDTNNNPKILKVNCKGKFIYFEIEGGWYIFNRLGMSGIWSHNKGKHTSLILTYSSQQKNQTKNKDIFFIDQRHFGIFEFTNKKSILNQKLNSIGPDLLNDNITYSQFETIILNHQKKNICKVLMDQSIFSGIGNYLKSEILYEAHIHPLTNINQLSPQKLKLLFNTSRKLIRASYLAQGTSLRHYKNVESVKGQFEFQLKVYQRKQDPDGNPVKRIMTPDKRSTFFVDNF